MAKLTNPVSTKKPMKAFCNQMAEYPALLQIVQMPLSDQEVIMERLQKEVKSAHGWIVCMRAYQPKGMTREEFERIVVSSPRDKREETLFFIKNTTGYSDSLCKMILDSLVPLESSEALDLFLEDV
jgi:hypothetical protein